MRQFIRFVLFYAIDWRTKGVTAAKFEAVKYRLSKAPPRGQSMRRYPFFGKLQACRRRCDCLRVGRKAGLEREGRVDPQWNASLSGF
jgi:hypothetical protein